MKYQFRLTFSHSICGAFAFHEQSVPLKLEAEHEYTLVARDAKTLIEARKFHIEGCNFLNEQEAKNAGERMRTRLRVLNAILALGITIPLTDKASASFSSAVKNDMFEKTGGILLDSISGLSVFPDDGKHFEFNVSMNMNVRPSEPDYILDAIRDVWSKEITFDDNAETALNIINISTTESSPKAKFLTTYLALEQLIERQDRNDSAIEVIQTLQSFVDDSSLSELEKQSLKGSISNLLKESFSSALIRFAAELIEPKEFAGLSARKFFSKCIETRNKIAHNAVSDFNDDLNLLSSELRQIVLAIIWTKNKNPDISIKIPASSVSMDTGKFTISPL